MLEIEADYPRARYLSQQFVEELCSAEGMTDALLQEIERIVFEAHDVSSRDGAVDFGELLEMRALRHRQVRVREEEALAVLSDRIGSEIEKTKQVSDFKAQVVERKRLIAGLTADRAKLAVKGSEARVARLESLTKAADRVRSFLRQFNAQEQSLLVVKDEVADVRLNRSPETLRRLQERHAASGLKGEEWAAFRLDYTGNVDTVLEKHLQQARKSAASWRGTLPVSTADGLPLVPEDADLNRVCLAVLEAEIARLERLISTDRDTANKFSALSKKIVEENAALERIEAKLADCEGAQARIDELVKDRKAGYTRIFDAILAEQAVLTDLYSPLMTRLASGRENVRKLSISIRRVADISRWAAAGEELLDHRKLGPFKGRGMIRSRAEEVLRRAWETGDSGAVSAAMADFRNRYVDDLLAFSPVPKTEQVNYRAWLKRFATWLYSTEHISLHYSIDYDGIDIRKLSPGTRGIVLLLLYLALDEVDERPLIIDQPEENLDPKSIFDELVALFCEAKRKRQVIVVTHNANLVVNTDADQIIIAKAGPHAAGSLPPITYTTGGLESEPIRQEVCNILEGGEAAFAERARRLRVKIGR